MIIREYSYSYEEHENIDSLDAITQALVKKSIEAAGKSYSPYSHFPVGAAVLLEDGSIYLGNNQENRSFPAGTCAERTVLNFVKANYPDKIIKTIAITAPESSSESPVAPCGFCRQVMLETESVQSEPMKVILYKMDGKAFVFNSIKKLMPLAFEEKKLGK